MIKCFKSVITRCMTFLTLYQYSIAVIIIYNRFIIVQYIIGRGVTIGIHVSNPSGQPIASMGWDISLTG